MDASFESERQMIVDEVRRFVDREVIPVAHNLEHDDIYPVDLVHKLSDLVHKLSDLGLLAATIPEVYGGLVWILRRIHDFLFPKQGSRPGVRLPPPRLCHECRDYAISPKSSGFPRYKL